MGMAEITIYAINLAGLLFIVTFLLKHNIWRGILLLLGAIISAWTSTWITDTPIALSGMIITLLFTGFYYTIRGIKNANE